MPEKETQRGPELDIVELIANLIASYSHLFELYNSLSVDLSNPDSLGEEEFGEKIEQVRFIESSIDKVYQLRKIAMSTLKDLSPSYNKQAHCLLKHGIASYQYAQELWDTDRGNEKYQELVLDCAQYMYSILSFYMGVDIALCGRCLKDALDEEKDLNIK